MTCLVLCFTVKIRAFAIILCEPGAELLEKKLLAISTPGSKAFRKYLTKSEITEIVGHGDDDIQRITRWYIYLYNYLLNVFFWGPW